MKQIFKYIRIILSYIHGLLLCVYYSLLPKRKLECRESGPYVIVSLTSYGRRVSRTLKYAVYSMIHQTFRPDRIVIWLDETAFSRETLPASVRRLEKYGVEICYCHDIKSYKKLVPSLVKYPDDIIITIDDDLVYKRTTIEGLMRKHQQYPDDVICSSAHIPTFGQQGLLPYKQWRLYVKKPDGKLLFPLGGSGTLYPPGSLYKDVTDDRIFMKVAPMADDVWFWFMTMYNGKRIRLAESGTVFRPIDLLYQLTHKKASLMQDNIGKNRNDIQIAAVFSYYGIEMDKDSIEKMLTDV